MRPSGHPAPNQLDAADAFVGKVVEDLAASLSSLLVCLGDTLGLYRALAASGPVTPGELASASGVSEVYVRDWLLNQAASDYVSYDEQTGRYFFPPEHAAVLADAHSPHYLGQGFHAVRALVRAHPEVFDALYDPPASHLSTDSGGEPFLIPGTAAHLVQDWIPALTGVHEKLLAGATAAEVGCGVGTATIAMAKAYPEAHFWGFDAELSSIRFAERTAQAEGVAAQTTFEARPPQLVANHQYALVTVLSSLFRFDDPPSVARRIRTTLAPAGSLLLVEPGFVDRAEDSFTPAARLYSALSALRQWPAAGHAQTAGTAYAHRVELLLAEAGFSQVRLIASTPFLRALEARR
jgi:2-polyprenyl-3-methyl-5-hydroxy-6-metoxy-1,4-benzoquinol methylase